MKNKQILLRALLVTQILVLGVYTMYVINKEGFTLLDVFIGNIASFQWNGQFNLDFSCYLALSGLWIMWRNKFSISSVGMAIFATIIGIMAFAPYVLYLLAVERGNLKKVLVGER